ncbi:sensor histidine kinase [Loktanella sp. M215]|uniref:sensor histidine kinase n=1 Tax=Loktanella sp. M215 TaxID=2675431 RepID=UPI001F19DA4C|nr:HAMP domain-containing sensor histidine kinase [Loktanella sp. M215]MCF7702440.1 sensor histidine kinase [Loktanella sp. M215]
MTVRMSGGAARAAPRNRLKHLQDYARAVKALTWQRQGIFAAVALLTGWFFTPWKAELFFAVGMLCEIVDLRLANRVDRVRADDVKGMGLILTGFVLNTIVSASTIGIYAVWVALTEDGVGMFTALFCLFAGAIFAAMNNHQIARLLAIRLTIYAVAFLVMTMRDLVVYRPPLSSDLWLQFFTVMFVMYFLIDCSLSFLRMYRTDLKRLEDLQAEHERTKAALVVKSQFVAAVSHELRTPLTSIKGSLDLINTGKFGELPPRVQNLLTVAGRNSKRLADLVDDLLDLQKLEEGQMTFDNQTIEVRSFLADAVGDHQGLAERYNVNLNFRADDAPAVHVHADRARLMQVLSNMISNAAKFSMAKGDVDIGLSVAQGWIRIFVRDYGIGIPDDSKAQVFERFRQLDPSDQRKCGGTGLGMNISREIVAALGGLIDYDSTVGVGTTFYVDLPCTGSPG